MPNKGTCRVDNCEKDVRAKRYCDRHYRLWKKGKMGKPRYRSCNDEGCSQPAQRRGLCGEHFGKKHGKKPAAEEAPSSAASGAGDNAGADASAGETAES